MTSAGPRVLASWALCLLYVAACAPRHLGAENDRLRARVMDLENEVAALERRNREMETAVAAPASPDTLSRPADVLAATPRVVSIALSRPSHVREDDGSGTTLVLYVKPTDGRGRFVQMVGHLAVHAAVVPADGDARTIGRVEVDPAALRDAYRSGLTGTHYTIEMPVTLGPDEGDCTVRVVFRDGLTGRTLETQRVVARTP